ncbi:Gp138 family membrane-puncturing spike protein [Paenibacillus sp. WQ 127069]|uniref:Gp138 family membrane-puncturing spike protein n=1 Tax=Paenibacillus baimaensis TaxID=2982185 RepID=A0ABT2UJ45_9BACL|nr:Gp138 family membrane-puncturing spike protein [Paenibacillus sp. WQ 127069]MCU6794151.1 Gp138 family membrane-puncturing spike protein [Paenibacillus sp. WQ 127069]
MSIVDPGSAVNAFVVGMLEKAFDDLYVCFPCTVISFHPGDCKAVVQPLVKAGSSSPAVIQNVSVLGQKFKIKEYEQTIIEEGVERTITMKEHDVICIPNVSAGDTVVVVCADVEIKNTLSGQIASPDSKRRHSKNDAVIVGVLPWSLLN